MRKIILNILMLFAVILFISAQESGPQATTATAGTLTVTSTVSYSSPYYYAVWLNNPGGTFLRTLTMYGSTTKYYSDLVHWNSDSNTNKTNAVTGATKSSSSPYTSTWNGTDQANSTQVADGDYTVRIEMSSESYGTNSKYITATFSKGPNAQTLTPTNVSPILNISIKWLPVNTAINNVEMDKLYSVYPNPAISSIFVSGSNIKGVDICSLSGEMILNSKEQSKNLSTLTKGVYLAVIYTKSGTVVKKIEKL